MKMGTVVLRWAKGIGFYFLFMGTVFVIRNKLDGKDWLGRRKLKKKKTFVDWKGNVVLGTEDYCVG